MRQILYSIKHPRGNEETTLDHAIKTSCSSRVWEAAVSGLPCSFHLSLRMAVGHAILASLGGEE